MLAAGGEDLDALFARYDADRDGRWSRRELGNLVVDVMGAPARSALRYFQARASRGLLGEGRAGTGCRG